MGDARNHCWVYQRRKSFVVKKTKFFFLLFCARGSWLYDQNYLGSKVLHRVSSLHAKPIAERAASLRLRISGDGGGHIVGT